MDMAKIALSALLISFSAGCTTGPQSAGSGKAVLRIVSLEAVETDEGEDEPYFLERSLGWCSGGKYAELQIQEGFKEQLLWATPGFSGRIMVEAWDKDGATFDCFKKDPIDDWQGTFSAQYIAGVAMIDGAMVKLGEEKTITVGDMDAKYKLTLRLEPLRP